MKKYFAKRAWALALRKPLHQKHWTWHRGIYICHLMNNLHANAGKWWPE